MKTLFQNINTNPFKNIKNLNPRHPSVMFVLFSIVFASYGLLLKKHYALDTYVTEAYGNQVQQHIKLGRYLSAGIWEILTAAGVNTAVYQSLFTFLSLCLLTISIFLLIQLFFQFRDKWDTKSLLFLCLASVVSLSNVFILHWFLFPEVVVFLMTGLTLSILAIYFLGDRDTGATSWIPCYILLLSAISFYQAVGAIFVTFGMLYIIVREGKQPLLATLRGFASVLTVYVLVGSTNILLIKWYGLSGARTDFQDINPLNNLSSLIENLYDKLQQTNLGLAPVHTFALLMFLLFTACGVLLWKYPNRQGPLRLLFLLAALISGSFLSTFAPHLMTSSVDVSPRSIVALMSLPGAISLFVFLQLSIFKKPLPFYLLLGFLSVFFLANMYVSHRVETSRLATNRLDREIAEKIYQEILRYEETTRQTVNRIAFRHDESPTLCYPGLVCYGNFRAMGRDWTVVPLMSIISGRPFTQTSMPDKFFDSFFAKHKNWNQFNNEQVVIKGDTLYLMLY